VGVYYLAKKHQMERSADNIDGSHVGDAAFIKQVIREVRWMQMLPSTAENIKNRQRGSDYSQPLTLVCKVHFAIVLVYRLCPSFFFQYG